MNWKIIFERGMFWIILIPFILVVTGLVDIGTYEVNKTIGWSYDIPDFQIILAGILTFSCFIFLIGYGILFFSRIKTNLKLSIIHFIIFCTSYMMFFYKILGFILVLLSLVIFIMNMFWAFKNRKTINQ